MLADIATGNTGFADIMFLVAFICFALEFVSRLVRSESYPYPFLLVSAGLACTALGFLVL